MSYWLLKTEPSTYSWDDLCKEQKTLWTGIRNFQARNFLREMKAGDLVFIYHSGDERMIVGLARVTQTAQPEETEDNGDWVAVQIEAFKPFAREVTLDEMKNTHGLTEMIFIRQSRLSVAPVTDAQAVMILKIGKM